jgi:LEA14-like dessication related protein
MIQAPRVPARVAPWRRPSTGPTAALYHTGMRSVSILLLALALSACSLLVPKLQTPSLSIIEVQVLRANFMEQQLRVRMHVQNPNDRSLPVQGLSYTVYLGGQQFATGVSDASFIVPALGSADFNMDVTANAAGALFTILNERRGQGVDYRMKGRVELSHGWLRSIPFEESGTFTLR